MNQRNKATGAAGPGPRKCRCAHNNPKRTQHDYPGDEIAGKLTALESWQRPRQHTRNAMRGIRSIPFCVAHRE